MPKTSIAQIRQYIQDFAGCSRREATRAANRCANDPEYGVRVLGIEKYHQLFSDETGETAVSNVIREEISA